MHDEAGSYYKYSIDNMRLGLKYLKEKLCCDVQRRTPNFQRTMRSSEITIKTLKNLMQQFHLMTDRYIKRF